MERTHATDASLSTERHYPVKGKEGVEAQDQNVL
jgi:hypothetical protein